MIAAIDIGTSSIKVATLDASGHPVVVKSATGLPSTPSDVFFPEGGDPVIGEEAINAGLAEPGRWVRSSKRKLGADEVLFTAENGEQRARDIVPLLLTHALADIERATGETPTEIALAVPANFTDRQRREMLEAAAAAGVPSAILVQEPTAAAIAFSGRRPQDGVICIVDAGAGTTDVSVVEFAGSDRSVRMTGGEPHLGGDDFTRWVEAEILAGYTAAAGFTPDPERFATFYADLAQRAETVKKSLSSRENVSAALSCDGKAATVTVHRAKFEKGVKKLVGRLVECVQRTLAEAQLAPADLREVLLVGGACQSPMIKTALEKALGRPVAFHPEPGHAVALGGVLALQAELEAKGCVVTVGGERIPPISLRVRDITTYPVGVAVLDREDRLVNRVILPKGVPIPSDQTVPFKLADPDQDDALIQILQGDDRAAAEGCHPLGVFELQDIAQGEPRIEIRLRIDRGGVIHASASHPASGRTADLRIDAPATSA